MTLDSTPDAAAPANLEPKAKSVPSRKDVENILASLEPAEAPAPTAAEKERAKRIATLEKSVVSFANTVRDLGLLDARDTTKAVAAAKALEAVLKNARAAIETIPDAKLVDTPRAVAKPRQSTTRTLSESDAQAAVARAEEPTPEDGLPDEHPEAEPDASLQANNDQAKEPRQEEAATAAPMQRRSGPPSRQAAPAVEAPVDARGDEDPNAGDGF